MSSVLLVDPALIDVEAADNLTQFWARVSDWNLDKRTRLGPWTFSRYLDLYNRAVEADSEIVPASLRQIVFRTLSTWLQRGPLLGEEVRDGDGLDHTYLGGDACFEDLLGDIYSSRAVESLALASAEDFWAMPTPSAVTTLLKPHVGMSVHTRPNQPTESDRIADQHSRCSHIRLVIVGGRPEGALVERLERELGIPSAQVVWHASEPHRNPPAIGPIARGAAQSGAVVVCLTGAIAHTTMYDLRNTCHRAGATYLWSQYSTGVIDVVLSHVLGQPND